MGDFFPGFSGCFGVLWSIVPALTLGCNTSSIGGPDTYRDCSPTDLLDGASAISGYPRYDAYFDAVTDAVAEAEAIADGFADAQYRLAATVGAEYTPVQDIVAAFDARMTERTDGAYSVSVLPARCSISTDVVMRTFGACDPRDLEEGNSPSCNGACLSNDDRCSAGETAVCHGVAPNLICSGECRGECSARVDVDSCVGRCEGRCVGSCTVLLDDEPCEGTCVGAEEGGACTGACRLDYPDGSVCNGTCSGTCDAECQAVVEENGVCTGQCLGECTYLPRGGRCVNTLAECSSSQGNTTCAGTCIGDVEPPSGLLACELAAAAASKVQATCTTPFVNVHYEPLETLGAQERALLDAFVGAFRAALGDVLTYEARAAQVMVALEDLERAIPGLNAEVEETLDELWSGSVATRNALQCAQYTLDLVPEATHERHDLIAVSYLVEQLREELGADP